jgi:adhesin/invasin
MVLGAPMRLVNFLILGVAALTACDATAPLATPAVPVLHVVSGDNQQGVVGQELPAPVVVRVVDADGRPLAGQRVKFLVETGLGSVDMEATITDAEGIAQREWRLGRNASMEQRLFVWVVDASTGHCFRPERTVQAAIAEQFPEKCVGAVVEADAVAAPPFHVTKVSGDGGAGFVATPVASPPRVRVTDQFGNPNSGVSVTFSILDGGGHILGASSATTVTDVYGLATVVDWTLGFEPGPNTMRALAKNLETTSPVTFVITAISP